MKENTYGNPPTKKSSKLIFEINLYHINLRKSENNIKELEIKPFLS